MARLVTPTDAHNFINAVADAMQGKNATMQAIDTASFVSVGTSLYDASKEKLMETIVMMTTKRIVDVRAYKGKFKLIEVPMDVYNTRFTKTHFYSKGAQLTGWFNTDASTPHAMGAENTIAGNGSQWEQNPPVIYDEHFSGMDVWDDSYTIYEEDLKYALLNEANFNAFVNGMIQERENDIEQQKEALNRATVLNYMAAKTIYSTMPNSTEGVNLTFEFNTEYGTTYTTKQLLTTYRDDFYKFFVNRLKKDSNMLTNRDVRSHLNPKKTINNVEYNLLKHSPKDKQKLMLNTGTLIDMETYVLPAVFNDQYLKIENYEAVDYWQNPNEPMKIKLEKVAYCNAVTGAASEVNYAGMISSTYNASSVLYLGILFDTDALMIAHQLETTRATSVEAKKGYSNVWMHFSKNPINSFVEKGIVYFMADPKTA